MKKYTTRELEDLGYKIENALIKDVDLSMADHGCITFCMVLDGGSWGITFCMVLDGGGWGCVWGNRVLGHGYLGAEFNSYLDAMEYIMRIMDTVGVDTFKGLKNQFIRVATKGWGSEVKIIGNILKDKWFDPVSFFADKEKENGLD